MSPCDYFPGEQIASPSSATEVAIAPTRTHQSSHTEAPSQINQARVLPQASTARAPLQASQANVMTHSYTEVRYNSSLTTKTRQFGMTSQSHLSAESKLAHVIMASSIPQLPHEQAAPHRNAESVKRGTGSLLLWRLIIPVLSIVGLILALSATVVCVSTFIRLKVLRYVQQSLLQSLHCPASKFFSDMGMSTIDGLCTIWIVLLIKLLQFPPSSPLSIIMQDKGR